jgi:hypothetical protein
MSNTAQHDDVERATQGFVANLSWLRHRPSLTLLEVAWRWCFGIPALLLVYRSGAEIFASTPWQTTGIQDLSVNQLLTDPLAASTTLANFAAIVAPGFYRAAFWLAPMLLLAWAVVSGLGRTIVLRRVDSTLKAKPLTLIVLQLLRVLPLAAAATLWWLGLRALAQWSILGPIAAGGEPQIMLYVGGAIALTLGLFVLSAASGWVFSMAPLLAMLQDTGVLGSLRGALRVGRLRNGLVEINMVLGIVKIALLVLAMVFSACPLPFQSVTTDEFLFWWNVAVAIWYFLASDFFHVSRLVAYLHLWQAAHD